MPTIYFGDKDTGAHLDTNPLLLTNNQWSQLLNVRIRNQQIETMGGDQFQFKVYDGTDTDTILQTQYIKYIDFTDPDTNATPYYLVITTNGRVWSIRPVGTTTVQDQPTMTVALNSDEDGSVLTANSEKQIDLYQGGRYVIINDGVTTPRLIDNLSPQSETSLFPIPNWNYTTTGISEADQAMNGKFKGITTYTVADRVAKIVRSFDGVIYGANIDQNSSYSVGDNDVEVSGRAPSTIIASNIIIPGEPSGNIDFSPFSLRSNTADEISLTTDGPIVDLVPWQNSLLAFTDTEVHTVTSKSARLLSDGLRLGSTRLATDRGMVAQDCYANVNGVLYVMSNNDIYKLTGNSTESIVNNRIKDHIFSVFDYNRKDDAFVFHYKLYDEVWFCIPTRRATTMVPEGVVTAYVYNYTLDSWYLKTLGGAVSAAIGPRIRDVSTVDNEYNYEFGNDNTRLLIATVKNYEYDTDGFTPILPDTLTYDVRIYDQGTTLGAGVIPAENDVKVWSRVERSALTLSSSPTDSGWVHDVSFFAQRRSVDAELEYAITGYDVPSFFTGVGIKNFIGEDEPRSPISKSRTFTIELGGYVTDIKELDYEDYTASDLYNDKARLAFHTNVQGKFVNHGLVGKGLWSISMIDIDDVPSDKRSN